MSAVAHVAAPPGGEVVCAPTYTAAHSPPLLTDRNPLQEGIFYLVCEGLQDLPILVLSCFNQGLPVLNTLEMGCTTSGFID